MLTEGLKPRMSRLLDLRSADPAAKKRWEEALLEFDRLRSRRLPLKRRSSTCRSRCLGLLPYTSLHAVMKWWLSQRQSRRKKQTEESHLYHLPDASSCAAPYETWTG